MGRANLWADNSATQQAALRRKASRHAVSTPCRIRGSAGDIAGAQIRDLSEFGCNIACDAGWLRPGQFIAIRLDREPPLQAIVRWSRAGEAGLEFLRPIPADRREWHTLIASPSYG